MLPKHDRGDRDAALGAGASVRTAQVVAGRRARLVAQVEPPAQHGVGIEARRGAEDSEGADPEIAAESEHGGAEPGEDVFDRRHSA